MRIQVRTHQLAPGESMADDALTGLVGQQVPVDGGPGTATVHSAAVEDGWLVLGLELDTPPEPLLLM